MLKYLIKRLLVLALLVILIFPKNALAIRSDSLKNDFILVVLLDYKPKSLELYRSAGREKAALKIRERQKRLNENLRLAFEVGWNASPVLFMNKANAKDFLEDLDVKYFIDSDSKQLNPDLPIYFAGIGDYGEEEIYTDKLKVGLRLLNANLKVDPKLANCYVRLVGKNLYNKPKVKRVVKDGKTATQYQKFDLLDMVKKLESKMLML